MITASPRKGQGVCPSSGSACYAWRRLTQPVRSRTHRPDNTESPDLAESNQIRHTGCECLRFGAIHSLFGLRTNKRVPPRATKLEAAHKAIMCITRRPLFLVSSHHPYYFLSIRCEKFNTQGKPCGRQRVTARVTAAQPRKAHACLSTITLSLVALVSWPSPPANHFKPPESLPPRI